MARIDVEVGAKTSKFSSGLAKLQAEADSFGRKVARKFGFADVGKSLMQSLGIGGVGAVASTLTSYFEDAANSARILYERTASALTVTQQLIRLRQTPAQQIKTNEKDISGSKTEIEMQKQLVDNLENSIFRYVPGPGGERHRELLAEAKRELSEMIAKQGQLIVANEELKTQERDRVAKLREEYAVISDQRDLMQNRITDEDAARRARERAAGRVMDTAGTPQNEAALLDNAKRVLAEEQAARTRELAQLHGIRGDQLARVGGGGGLYTPSGSRPGSNPVQTIANEATKHTALLTSINGKMGVRFSTSQTDLGLK